MAKKIALVLKFILIVVAFLITFGFITKGAITIDSYDAVVTINDAGDMSVVEVWDMRYNEEMRVRFRDIVYNKYADDYPLTKSLQNIAAFDEQNVSVRFYKDGIDRTSNVRVGYSFAGEYDELGSPIECYPNVNYCESIFVDARNAGGLEGDVIFEYTYTILGAITKYSDISELNWRLFEYAEAKVKAVHIEVNFPENAFGEDAINVWGHGLSYGTIEIASNKQVVMDMTNIKTGEFPEFRILTENVLFPNIDSKNTFITASMNKAIIMAYEQGLTDDTNARITVARVVLGVTIAMICTMLLITYIVYVKYDKEYVPEFKGDYFRELPSEDTPAEVSYLVYMKKINDETVAATLLDLIRRKYIVMDTYEANMSSSKADFKLKLVPMKDKSELLPHEKYFINWIFDLIGNGGIVTTKEIESYGKTDVNNARNFQSYARTFIKLAKKSAEKKNYFEYGFQTQKNKVILALLLPIIVLLVSFWTSTAYNINNTYAVILCFASILIYSAYAFNIKKRSVTGNELYTKWMAFKKFLLEFSKMDDYPIPGIIVWEHFLVYATVFNIADTVNDQLKVKLPKEELENSDSTYLGSRYYSHGFYYGSMLNHFRTTFSIAKMNSTSTIVAANTKRSGFGGGGGFSGGSSFGGGGGGGRSR